ncbi:MAG TPA: hypothetical protein VM076_14925 [Gemmatimonadaceae bacterium]|nr:hypothetical protein [Gemmatimonadaceae bacterium]
MPMLDSSVTKKLSNEDRMILAETFAAGAEQHLAPAGDADYQVATSDAVSLCEVLGIPVTPAANTFAGERERVILAYGYALRIRRALAGQRTRDLPRFVEGLCQNLGLDVEGAEYGAHTKDVMEHVELHLGE